MWYAISLGVGVVIGFVISRYFDSKLDVIQAKLEEIVVKIKK
jgi:uncharacterized membrane-anchored protein YhcB (DUF1043 family)